MDQSRQKELIELLPRLRRFGVALTGSVADADDVLQSTIERLLVKGVPEDAHLGKWAFRVCRNIWIDEVRYRKIRTAPDTSDRPDRENSEDGERQIMDQITLSEVNHAMQDLPDAQREALALVAIEGLSYQEAADILDVPTGTIMSRVARARKAMADKIDVHIAVGAE